MASFNLTAELNLRGPSNLNQVIGSIRRELSGLTLDLNINPNTSRSIQTVTSNIGALSVALRNAQNNATALSSTLSNLVSTINNAGNAATNTGNAINRLNNQARNTGNATNQAATAMEDFGRQSALAIRRFTAFSVATGAVYSFVRALGSAYSEFITFNKEFVRLQQVTNTTASGLSGLSQEITRLSTNLGVGSSELLNVATTLAQAGLSATETKTALEALAKSSLAPSFDNLNDTVEGSIALMRQFGLSAGDLESALGSINAVAAKFAVESGDIITAIQRTGGVFAAASKGVSQGKDALNEFIAVFTSVRATTRESAETIATGLRTIFTRIQRGGTIQALKEYGIVLTDLENKFVGPYEAVRRLSEGLKSLDPRDLRFSAIVEELGGFRQIGKVIPLIQQFATAQQALGVAQRGAGSLAGDAAKAQEALAVRVTKVREEFIALIRDIGQSQGFQKFVDIALQLSSALISVASAAKDVLPAIAAISAIRAVPAIGQFAMGFGRGVSRRNNGGPIRRFASGGLVPGSGSGDTVSAMLTPGEFVIRKKAVETIGASNLAKMNKGGSVQRFAGGSRVGSRKGMSLGARSKFKDLTEEELSKLSTADMIKYAKAQARDIFSTGGAGMVTSSKFVPVPQERIVPELEKDLTTYLGQKGFWQEVVSPFGRPSKSTTKAKDKSSRQQALKRQESKMADEVAARSQQWTNIRSGSPIDNYLLSALKDPILSDYKTVKSGGLLSKPFYNTRLRQSVNKALESYDDFDYSPGNIDKLVSSFAAKRFASGGIVQKFAKGGNIEQQILSQMVGTDKANKKRYGFGLVGLRSGTASRQSRLESFDINANGPKSVDLHIGTLSEQINKKFSQNVEKEITSSLKSTIVNTANSLKGELGSQNITPADKKQILTGSALSSAVGSVFESALSLLGSPYLEKTEKTKSIDFPFGLGALSGKFGIPSNVPTDATRTVGGRGKGLSDMKGQIVRFIKAIDKKEFTKAENRLAGKKAMKSSDIGPMLSSIKGRLTTDFNKSNEANALRSKYGITSRSAFNPRSIDSTIRKVAEKGQGKEKELLKDIMSSMGIPYTPFAVGGNVSGQDTVPALLTPGEFVINKEAASRLGSARLNQLNQADKIEGFNKGGAVGDIQSFASGGGVQRFFIGGVVRDLSSLLGNLSTSIGRAVGVIDTFADMRQRVSRMQAQGYSRAEIRQSEERRAVTRRFIRDPSTLVFGSGLIGQGISSAVGGAKGEGLGSATTAVASVAGIAASLGLLTNPLGILVTGVIAAGSAVQAYNKSIRDNRIQENNKKIETASDTLSKTLDKLGQSATLSGAALDSIGQQLGTIFTAERSNVADIKTNADPGVFSTLLGTVVNGLGSLVGFKSDTGKTDTKKLASEISTATKASAEQTNRAFTELTRKGLTPEQAIAQLSKRSGIDTNEITLAIARSSSQGSVIADAEAKLAEIELRDQKRQTLGAASVALGPDYDKEVIDAQRKAQRSRIAMARMAGFDEQKQIIIEQNKIKATTDKVVSSLNLFSEAMKNVGAAVSRASAEFQETQRQIDIGIGSSLGQRSRISTPSKMNENVLQNLRAYSNEEIGNTIDTLGSRLGLSPEVTAKAKGAALSQRILETELPRILSGITQQERQGGLGDDRDTSIRKQLTNALGLSGIQGEDANAVVDEVIKNLSKLTKGEVSIDDLLNNNEALAKLYRSNAGALQSLNDILQSYNGTMEAVTSRLNEYVSALESAISAQNQATQIRSQGGLQLAEATGQKVTLAQRNQLVDQEIMAMTSTIGPGGRPTAGTGTLDPDEIARRLVAAEREKKDLEEKKDKGEATKFAEDLTRVTLQINQYKKALEKLSSDTTKASNALNEISRLRQLKETRRESFLDFVTNMNNPEYLINLMQKGGAFARVMSGKGRQEDIGMAREALRMRASSGFVDTATIEAETQQLTNEVIKIVERISGAPISPEMKEMIAQDFGKAAEEKDAIESFNRAIEAQARATEITGTTIRTGAEYLYTKVIEAADAFLVRVGGAGAMPVAAPAEAKARGGLIYANEGQYVNFQPRGTDTVPAMLTPGEFVVNAKATKNNLGLLKAINDGNKVGGYSKGGVVYLAGGGSLLPPIPDRAYQARANYKAAQKAKLQAYEANKRSRLENNPRYQKAQEKAASKAAELAAEQEEADKRFSGDTLDAKKRLTMLRREKFQEKYKRQTDLRRSFEAGSSVGIPEQAASSKAQKEIEKQTELGMRIATEVGWAIQNGTDNAGKPTYKEITTNPEAEASLAQSERDALATFQEQERARNKAVQDAAWVKYKANRSAPSTPLEYVGPKNDDGTPMTRAQFDASQHRPSPYSGPAPTNEVQPEESFAEWRQKQLEKDLEKTRQLRQRINSGHDGSSSPFSAKSPAEIVAERTKERESRNAKKEEWEKKRQKLSIARGELNNLTQRLGREPTDQEIMDEFRIPEEQVQSFRASVANVEENPGRARVRRLQALFSERLLSDPKYIKYQNLQSQGFQSFVNSKIEQLYGASLEDPGLDKKKYPYKDEVDIDRLFPRVELDFYNRQDKFKDMERDSKSKIVKQVWDEYNAGKFNLEEGAGFAPDSMAAKAAKFAGGAGRYTQDLTRGTVGAGINVAAGTIGMGLSGLGLLVSDILKGTGIISEEQSNFNRELLSGFGNRSQQLFGVAGSDAFRLAEQTGRGLAGESLLRTESAGEAFDRKNREEATGTLIDTPLGPIPMRTLTSIAQTGRDFAIDAMVPTPGPKGPKTVGSNLVDIGRDVGKRVDQADNARIAALRARRDIADIADLTNREAAEKLRKATPQPLAADSPQARFINEEKAKQIAAEKAKVQANSDQVLENARKRAEQAEATRAANFVSDRAGRDIVREFTPPKPGVFMDPAEAARIAEPSPFARRRAEIEASRKASGTQTSSVSNTTQDAIDAQQAVNSARKQVATAQTQTKSSIPTKGSGRPTTRFDLNEDTPKFRIQGTDRKGKEMDKVIQAASEDAAVRAAEQEGMYLIFSVSNDTSKSVTGLAKHSDGSAAMGGSVASKPRTFNHGGIVYASNGTLVPYQSRGSDTVPAMLTPGEFVVNRSATQRNLPLLKAINNNAQYLNKGGKVAYLAEGGQPSGSISSGGTSSFSLDSSEFTSATNIFSQTVGTLKSSLDGFVSGASELSSGASSMAEAVRGVGTSLGALSVATSSLQAAANTLASPIASFTSALQSMSSVLQNIPKNIDLNIKGSIPPISIVVEVNGGEGIQEQLKPFADEIYSKIGQRIAQATNGNLKIETTSLS